MGVGCGCCSEGVRAWLDGDAAYLCTAYSPSCFVIQKMKDTQTASTSRSATLNPEALDFCLPPRENCAAPSSSNVEKKEVHLFMNGDVGKESCGDQCPTYDPHDREMSTTPKHGSDSDLPVEKMTEDNSSSNKMKDNTEVSSTPAEGKDNPPNGESVVEEKKEKEKEKEALPAAEKTDGDDKPEKEKSSDEETSTTTTSQSETQVSNEPLTREQIKQLVGQNVEYFFSRENWSSDPYLLSQMDSDQYVPVYILANCSQFKSITKDHSIIMDVLKDSVFVQLDEENNRVRPNYKRCIVILREIPKTTPVKEIEAMFEGEGCPKSLSCEFVHNDFWYVTFESDSDAQKAYRYLRETVKTFKDKPILARIKTKPVSRIGCLSVLPSYGAKNQGETREPMPNQVPGGNNCVPPGGNSAGPGIQGIPNPPPPPNAYPTNPQRMFYPHQNSMNPSYPNYNFPGSAPIPTAYFYPNPLMQWGAPNFYDINSFIQYNGLSPRATFKPPTNARNKNRDSRFDKTDPKQSSSSVNGSATQVRSNHSISRPQSAHSPYPSSRSGPQNTSQHHSLNNHQSVQPSSNIAKGETSTNNPNSSSSSVGSGNNASNTNSTVAPTSQNSFAQNDLSIASQSDLYTSFTPPGASGAKTTSVGKVDTKSAKGDKGAGAVTSQGANSKGMDSTPTTETPPPTSTSTSASTSTEPAATTTTATTTTTPCSSSTIQASAASTYSQPVSTVSNTGHTSQQGGPQNLPPSSVQHQPPQPPSGSHRSNFSGESHSIRESQSQRPMSRGSGRRRLPRREEEMNGYPGPGGGRGAIRGGPGGEHPKNGAVAEPKKPSFELQETSFPPLPSAEEVAASIPAEKPPEAPPQAAWSGETHKFSDVMKGTAKPKQPPPSATTPAPPPAHPHSHASAAPEKETPPPKSQPHPSAPPPSTGGTGGSVAKAEEKPPTAAIPPTSQSGASSEASNSSSTTPAAKPAAPVSESSSGVVGSTSGSTSIPAVTTSTATTTSTAAVSSITTASQGAPVAARPERVAPPAREPQPQPPPQQRPQREDRRGLASQGLRRDRDTLPGIGRGGPRKEREGASLRLSGNKENRPQVGGGSSRSSWREEQRPDPDGWITKGPRETRSHRYQNQNQQQGYYDSRTTTTTTTSNNNAKTHTMVNGDSSPPASPHRSEVKHMETVPSKTLPPSSSSSRVSSKSEAKIAINKQEMMVIEKEKDLNDNKGEHKTSWAKMALASKDQMERLSAELKEKEEQERLKKIRTTKPPNKLAEKVAIGREREGKPFRRENFSPRDREPGERVRDFRGTERPAFGIKFMKEVVPKSPK